MTVAAVGGKTLKVRPRRGGGVASYFGGDAAAPESGLDILAAPGTVEPLTVSGDFAAAESGADTLAATGDALLPAAPEVSNAVRVSNTQIDVTISGGFGADSWSAQYRVAGSSTWIEHGAPEVGSSSYSFTGLSADTAYEFRVVATNAAGSAASNTVTQTTAATTAFFSDNFDRSTITPYSDGGAAYSGAVSVSIESASPLRGSGSARFRFGPDADGEDSWSELAIKGSAGVGRQMTEFSLRYTLKLPANFVHRTQSGSANNKGIVQLWSGTYGAAASNQFLGFEYWPDGAGGSILSFRWGLDGKERHFFGTGNPSPSNMWTPTATWPGTTAGSMFAPSDPGKVMQFRVYVKLASGPGAIDGIIRVWKYVQGSSPVLALEILDWPYCNRGNYIDKFYILGASNSGFTDETIILVDDLDLMESGVLEWSSFP